MRVSVDLVSAVQHLLVLFRDAHVLFRSPSGMHRAIDRYEQCWLPLLKTHGKTPLVPPADVEWVWYCHAISGAYERDCAGLASTYAPILESEAQWSATMNRTRQLWEDAYLKNASHTCCHEPFHLTGSNVAALDAKRPAVKVLQRTTDFTTAYYCLLLTLLLGLDAKRLTVKGNKAVEISVESRPRMFPADVLKATPAF